MNDINDIIVMQELIRENKTLRDKIASIEDKALQIKIAKSTDIISSYNKDCKAFNDLKTDLRKAIESSSAYNDVANRLAQDGKHKVLITDNFSITPYIKNELDDILVTKYYKDNNIDLPIIEKTISKFTI
jgi:hypothetical protein|tara:strand:+ start:229 stop:618 length:390 start_codon:yes stop_codon:yes gene_type:complete